MATAWLVTAVALSSFAGGTCFEYRADPLNGQQPKLAVIVPAYRGDLQRAVSSLNRWPAACSSLTQRNVDIVLYYAEGEEDDGIDEAVAMISQTAGQCFHRTRTVFANLDKQEDFYPKGPSIQFYKMFLDEDVRSQLVEYDALAIIEWDVLVASDSSFEELYKTAFAGGDTFWIKGSNVGGTNFHATAEVQEMWHVLGHINGNAIYNNKDPAFVEYIEYTRARWQYEYPYDVALWLTISDFPYSWPLWQRYSNKFVTTNLISYVGAEHVDSSSVSDAVAGNTLFIHGSRVDDGNIASRKAASELKTKRTEVPPTGQKRTRNRKSRNRRHLRFQDKENETVHVLDCTRSCGPDGDTSGLPEGTSTVCDNRCGDERARFSSFFCGAGNSKKFGSMCQLCFQDEDEARRVKHILAKDENDPRHGQIIMCDSMRPPESEGCTSDCLSKTYTTCDESCGSGRYGDYDCNWRDMGDKCRFCFDDVEAALASDEVAKRHGGRVIMCSTMEPPVKPEDDADTSSEQRSRHMQTTYTNRWKNKRWGESENRGSVDGFKDARKLEVTVTRTDGPSGKEVCLEDQCVSAMDFDGRSGRVCDETCVTEEFGTFGCGASDGIYGFTCRLCYIDEALALENDDPENNERAILCKTGLPVNQYGRRHDADSSTRAESTVREISELEENAKVDATQLQQDTVVNFDAPLPTTRPNLLRRLQTWKEEQRWKGVEKWKEIEKWDEVEKWDAVQKWVEVEKWDVVEKFQDIRKWEFEGLKTPEATGQEVCLDACLHTNSNGLKGRVCDDSCATGIPFGAFGCGTKSGIYGTNCRSCFFDTELALKNDDEENNERAIMCEAVLPVSVYDVGRRLSGDPASAENIGRHLKRTKKRSDGEAPVDTVPESVSEIDEIFAKMSHRPFTDDVTRGEICAFIAGRIDDVDKLEVTVSSILQFVPGMRVAVAVEGDLGVYYGALGNLSGVEFINTPNAVLAGLYADKYCGPGTRLIYYVETNSIVSRTFTAKDTHSPNGDLLVVYSDPRSRPSYELTALTSSILGIKSPSFTHGTELILPVEANAALRELKLQVSNLEATTLEEDAFFLEGIGDLNDTAAVPQIMAALQYTRRPSGIWFLNPHVWVAEHLFKPVSIWEIPLVKPRFACTIADDARFSDSPKVLQNNLDFLSRGGKCESGLITA